MIGWFSDNIKSRKQPIYICFGVGLVASLFFIGAEHVPAFIMMFLLFLLGFAASVQSLTFGIAKDIIPPKHLSNGICSGFSCVIFRVDRDVFRLKRNAV